MRHIEKSEGIGSKRTIGIVGGMGPAATAFFYESLVRATPATRDQEHVPVLISGDPRIPDRTEAILGGGPSPVPNIASAIQRLAMAGADLAVMPCNSAHYYYEELARDAPIPLLDMIDLTAAEARAAFPDVKAMGVLGTLATVQKRLYEVPLAKRGIALVPATTRSRNAVMTAIRAVKAGDTRAARSVVDAAASELMDQGAGALILACTDLSLCYVARPPPFAAVDSTRSLASASVRAAAHAQGSEVARLPSLA